MTKEEMVRLLRTDVWKWNQWRGYNLDEPFTAGLSDDTTFNQPGSKTPIITSRRPKDQCPSGVDLSDVDLSHANLEDARLDGVNLYRSDLFGARLYKACLVNANLQEADLSEAELSGANLENISLCRARLTNASLMDAYLVRADLREAELEGTNTSNTDLTEANLRGAGLYGTNFTGAYLAGTDFTNAALEGAIFCDVNLQSAIGLETTVHFGPSIIGVETIYRSQGNIPMEFLRGAGIPEDFIRYIPSLIGAQDGIQFHSCFISYSHKDEDFAQRLFSRLRDAKLRVWYAPEDLKGGRKLKEQIESAIHVQDKLLLVLSEASMQSEWVAHEMYTARQREKHEKRQILFPIALCPFEHIKAWKSFDADIGKDMAREVREYLIPDFTAWKDHDQFEAKFQRLLRDLKAEQATPTK